MFKKIHHHLKLLTSSPKGLKKSINFGNKVRTDNIANNIAIPVKTPKYIVGIKLDSINIEKPKIIVIDVLVCIFLAWTLLNFLALYDML